MKTASSPALNASETQRQGKSSPAGCMFIHCLQGGGYRLWMLTWSRAPKLLPGDQLPQGPALSSVQLGPCVVSSQHPWSQPGFFRLPHQLT